MNRARRRCVYTSKAGDRCRNAPMRPGSLVCEEHKNISVWECVASRIRDKAKLTLPYEIRGLLYLVVDALDLVRQHKLSSEEAKAMGTLVEAGVKVIQTGVIYSEKKFERRCMVEDRKGRRFNQAMILPPVEELERITDAEHEIRNP